MRFQAMSAGRVAVVLVLGLFTGPAAALDHLTLKRDGKTVYVDGRVVVTAQDGGILLLARDGVLWAVPPQEQVGRTSDEISFHPLRDRELSKTILALLPRGFDVHPTAHYMIFHDTSRAYAQWCGSLFERLYTAFRTYWTRKGFELSEPEFPLVAIVFADRRSYTKFSAGELGNLGQQIIAYYSLTTNRMTLYDLTGTEANGRMGRGSTTAQINQILASPDASRAVATVVHEATHQIAFNCGLHTRLSDCPRWFSEGIAIYFETPDLRSAKGWNGIGMLNQPRLRQFHSYSASRPHDSLVTLMANDKRFLDAKNGEDAYAESWALTYFLMRQHPKQYADYLQLLSAKKPLVEDGAEGRVKQFEECFGDLAKLDAEFTRYMAKVR